MIQNNNLNNLVILFSLFINFTHIFENNRIKMPHVQFVVLYHVLNVS
jgi:hypothetical protein